MVGKDMNYRGGNAVTGSLMDGLHVLLGTFAGWFCEWGIGALCGKWGLSFVCSTLVENPSSRRGDELTMESGPWKSEHDWISQKRVMIDTEIRTVEFAYTNRTDAALLPSLGWC